MYFYIVQKIPSIEATLINRSFIFNKLSSKESSIALHKFYKPKEEINSIFAIVQMNFLDVLSKAFAFEI